MQIFENNSAFYGARAAIGRSGWNRIDMLIGVHLHSGCLGYAFVVVVKMGKTFPPLSRSPKLLRMTFPGDFSSSEDAAKSSAGVGAEQLRTLLRKIA